MLNKVQPTEVQRGDDTEFRGMSIRIVSHVAHVIYKLCMLQQRSSTYELGWSWTIVSLSSTDSVYSTALVLNLMIKMDEWHISSLPDTGHIRLPFNLYNILRRLYIQYWPMPNKTHMLHYGKCAGMRTNFQMVQHPSRDISINDACYVQVHRLPPHTWAQCAAGWNMEAQASKNKRRADLN